MLEQTSTVAVEQAVEATVWVHRGTSGGIALAAADAVRGADAVEAVTVRDVRGIRPGSTDVRVDVVADIEVTVDASERGEDGVDAAAVESAVEDGVKVVEASVE